MQDGAIFYLVLNTKMNMIDLNFLILVNRYIKEVEAYDGKAVMVTINTGPKVFCSGFNLKYWAKAPGNGFLSIRMLHVVLARLLTVNVPTLCVVNGFAIAGGVLIALAHDKVIVNSNPNYRFWMNETENGFSIPYPLIQY